MNIKEKMLESLLQDDNNEGVFGKCLSESVIKKINKEILATQPFRTTL